MKYAHKVCPSCDKPFRPSSGRQIWCHDCRATKPSCPECESPVSGPAKWGPMWGGECDRAEQRSSHLLDSLARTRFPSTLIAA